MSVSIPPLRVLPPAAPAASRRSFLRYTGASAALGSLWLAGCKKEDALTAAPTITSFTPASGVPGATITLTGTNFAGATSLLLGTVATTFTVVSATTITFTVPATAQTGTISVTTPGGTATAGTTFTVLPTAAIPVNVGTGDAGVLNYAYALEQLEAAFYTQLRIGTYYTGLASNSSERLILDDLYYHEVIHREFLKMAITAAGVTPLKDLKQDFSSINFNDRTSVLGTAKAFEDLGVAAYNGAGQYLISPAYLFIAGKIVSVEARHAAIIRDLVSENTFIGDDIASLTSANNSSLTTNNSPAGSSLEKSKTPAEVVAVANTFLADGSKLDVSGIR